MFLPHHKYDGDYSMLAQLKNLDDMLSIRRLKNLALFPLAATHNFLPSFFANLLSTPQILQNVEDKTVVFQSPS